MWEALAGLLGLISGGIGQRNSMQLALAQLQQQRQQQQEMERLGTATRTDAYGNTVRYNPATNSWETTLSPMQKAISDASQSEQYKSLTQDAQRNRAAKERLDKVAKQATGDYNTQRAGYLYDLPPSEGAIANTLRKDITYAKEDAIRNKARDVTQGLLRQGRGSLVPSVLQRESDQLGSTTGDTLLQARQGAQQESNARQQSHQQQYLPAMQYLAQLIAQGGGSGVDFSTIAKDLRPTQSSAASGAIGAERSAAGLTNSGWGNLINASKGGLNMNALQMIVKGLSSGQRQQQQKMPWDDLSGLDFGNAFDYYLNQPNTRSSDFAIF